MLPSGYRHRQENRPYVLGTPDSELENQGHVMSKHSRARSHHSLHITDLRWATSTLDPTGPIKTPTLPGGLLHHRHHWAIKRTSTGKGCQISPSLSFHTESPAPTDFNSYELPDITDSDPFGPTSKHQSPGSQSEFQLRRVAK
ncbi:hypothetical protein AVEN_174324-1 [Araneus ventricosus]|uniref:Uncharacterized protein n=1 Tax=Araneus ventricosus TaxID=182803 RepID=A0A4Y2G4F9_ARAVE|nr:hypothetical protein AVEN_174324-1 [Araneus ventricosus]